MSLIIIDGNSLLHRAFYALPPMNNKEGKPTNAIYGFFGMLLGLIDEYKPEYLAVAFDRHEKTFRHERYSEYKAGRRTTPDDLRPQFPLLRESLEKMGICTLDLLGYEADDILGTVSKRADAMDIRTYVVTGDRDALQLAGGNVNVIITKKGVKEIELYNEEKLMEVYQLTPPQMIELKGLMGDTSDNIPGIPGVGEKTALKLLHQYPTIENLYENIDQLPKNKLYEKLVNNKESAFFSKMLATIIRDAPLEAEIESMRFHGFENESCYEALSALNFTTYIKRLGLIPGENAEEKKIETETIGEDGLRALIPVLNSAKRIAVLDAEDSVYIAFDTKKEYKIEFSQDLFGEGMTRELCFSLLKETLENSEVEKTIHDAKVLMHELDAYGISLNGLAHDTMLAAYVLDPSIKNYSAEKLFEKESAAMLFSVREEQEKKIKELSLEEIFYKIEMPLLQVLFEMECEGFRVDTEQLRALGEKYEQRTKELTEEIYQLAEKKFNIASPKQLGEFLFEDLQLPHGKKTKSGYSTDIEVLESIAELHPVVNKIIEYRQVTKLNSTYIDGLLSAANKKDSKVRTTFKQSAAATGRISSNEPNLQNIPVRQLSEIRGVFLPSDEEHILVAADYSQIELRVLASIAEDANMCDAFNNNEDIHARTASEVFGVLQSEVTSSMRSAAKAVNFGIVYGISDFGLAKNLGISRFEASQYIEKYLEEFSGVAKYMKTIVESAKASGYVKTLWGRIRYIRELASSNYNLRQFGERAAMNTPIQGSAADIIKFAMNSVSKRLKEEKLESKLIMQVHDELILDAKIDELEKVEAILIDCMENAFKLRVPLVVNIAKGKNWAEAK